MRVEVYWNLHKKCYSVRALSGERAGRVITHAAEVLICNAKMVVREAGRQKVLREKRKNVHAFVRGELAAYWGTALFEFQPTGPRITYNPYKFAHFMIEEDGYPGSLVPIKEAGAVRMGILKGFPYMERARA